MTARTGLVLALLGVATCAGAPLVGFGLGFGVGLLRADDRYHSEFDRGRITGYHAGQGCTLCGISGWFVGFPLLIVGAALARRP